MISNVQVKENKVLEANKSHVIIGLLSTTDHFQSENLS